MNTIPTKDSGYQLTRIDHKDNVLGRPLLACNKKIISSDKKVFIVLFSGSLASSSSRNGIKLFPYELKTRKMGRGG